jgi:hypothetical protein
MVVRADVGHMHAFSRPFGTDAIVKSPYPTLKGWAILEPSLRDEDENSSSIAENGRSAVQPHDGGGVKMLSTNPYRPILRSTAHSGVRLPFEPINF